MVAKIEQTSFDLLGKRWSALIVQDLTQGPRRFRELLTSLGRINDKVLSQRLKELEGRRIIDRRVFAEVPVRVEYTLTDKGKALGGVIEAMVDWDANWANGSAKPLRTNGAHAKAPAKAAAKAPAEPVEAVEEVLPEVEPETAAPGSVPVAPEPEPEELVRETVPVSTLKSDLEELAREGDQAGKAGRAADARVPFWKRLGL
ncbi:MAG: helix-turn-helix transcriptional regulator [Chloroflexi bacterium]|nr:helix-turn-helix transcriptional regulator [Chloroflexota bacterium]